MRDTKLFPSVPFLLADDEVLLQSTMRTWAREEHGLEAAADLDRHDRFPTEPLQGLGTLGLLGMTAPETEGGAGAGASAYALALFEVGQVCPNTAAVLASHTGMCTRAVLAAGDAAPDGLMSRLAAGEVAAWLATEEASGSDKRSFQTVAEPTEDGWLLRGQKVWSVAASDASHLLVTAQAPEGPTVFWVEADREGVHLGRNDPLLGLRAAGIRTVYLHDVHVPADRIVGVAGGADALRAEALPWLQLGVAAILLGCVAGASEAAARFAEGRVQFKEPIGRFQAVSDGIVRMDVQLAAGRSLLLEAAAHVEAGGDAAALWAARAKEYAQEVAIPMTRQAIRVQGGTGFMREGGTERFARDARALQFMGEPFAVQRDTIKRQLLDLAFDAAP